VIRLGSQPGKGFYREPRRKGEFRDVSGRTNRLVYLGHQSLQDRRELIQPVPLGEEENPFSFARGRRKSQFLRSVRAGSYRRESSHELCRSRVAPRSRTPPDEQPVSDGLREPVESGLLRERKVSVESDLVRQAALGEEACQERLM
jgi:hypothetical protein